MKGAKERRSKREKGLLLAKDPIVTSPPSPRRRRSSSQRLSCSPPSPSSQQQQQHEPAPSSSPPSTQTLDAYVKHNPLSSRCLPAEEAPLTGSSTSNSVPEAAAATEAAVSSPRVVPNEDEEATAAMVVGSELGERLQRVPGDGVPVLPSHFYGRDDVAIGRALDRLRLIGDQEPELSDEQKLANDQSQDDELLALEAIYGDNVFVLDRKGSLRSFKIHVHVDVPDGFRVSAKLHSSGGEP